MSEQYIVVGHAMNQQQRIFELKTYPGGKHSLVGENVRVHVYSAITDFFNRHLQP